MKDANWTQIVLDALQSLDTLTEWESEFIDSVADMPMSMEFSDKQKEVLLQIEEKMR